MTRAEAMKEIENLINRLDDISERKYILDLEANDIRQTILELEKIQDPIIPIPIIILK